MHLLIWVWAAWTDREILDLWWAPKPWRFETKSMEFSEGGRWHYAMVGPNGEKQYCLFDYKKIDAQEHFSGQMHFAMKTERSTILSRNAFGEIRLPKTQKTR